MKQEATVVLAGWLQKKGGRISGWKDRWFILHSDGYLCYFEKEVLPNMPSKAIKEAVLGVIPLSDAVSVGDSLDNDADGFCFDIVTRHRTFVIRAEGQESKRVWVDDIRNRIGIHKEFTVIKEGWLYKKGKFGKWVRRYVILGRHCLFYFETERDATGFRRIANIDAEMFKSAIQKYCKGVITLEIASVDVVTDHVMFNTFMLMVPSRKATFSARSANEVTYWMQAIRSMVLSRHPM